MDAFNGVTNETTLFAIVMFIGILVSMVIAYRDGYKSGNRIGEYNGYTKRLKEELGFYRDKPPTPPRQTKPGIIKPPEPDMPIPNRSNSKQKEQE